MATNNPQKPVILNPREVSFPEVNNPNESPITVTDPESITEEIIPVPKFPSIREMIEYLDNNVIGCVEAKRKLVISFKDIEFRFNHPEIELDKSNLLMHGATGSGKTYLVETLANYCAVPFIRINLTGKSPSGFFGGSIDDEYDQFLDKTHPDYGDFINENTSYYIPPPILPNSHFAIVYLDEIDKLSSNEGDHFFSSSLQNELIGLVEDIEIMDGLRTKDMLFIGTGAFIGLDRIVANRLNKKALIGFDKEKSDNSVKKELLKYATQEDLIKYGFKPELAGRFPNFTGVPNLTVDSLKDILSLENSYYEKVAQMLGLSYDITLILPEDSRTLIAQYAMSMGTNARGLKTAVNKVVEYIKFQPEMYEGRDVILTPDIVRERLQQ